MPVHAIAMATADAVEASVISPKTREFMERERSGFWIGLLVMAIFSLALSALYAESFGTVVRERSPLMAWPFLLAGIVILLIFSAVFMRVEYAYLARFLGYGSASGRGFESSILGRKRHPMLVMWRNLFCAMPALLLSFAFWGNVENWVVWAMMALAGLAAWAGHGFAAALRPTLLEAEESFS